MLAIGAIVVIVGVVIALRLIAGESQVVLDPHTRCPVARPPSAFEIVLIDASEGFNDPQRGFLQKFLETLESQIPDHAKVAVYVLHGGEESVLPEPTFEKCKPPSGKDASAWTQNPEKLRRDWQSSFKQPFNEALLSSLATPGANESPIMELIQKAAIEIFPAHGDDVPRRIVLISDMLEHTKGYSQYGAGPPVFESFRKQPFARHLHVDLSEVDVEVLYVARPGQERVQGRGHLEFWKDYFAWLGVGPLRLRITPVPG